MTRYKLILEYNGTNLIGFQSNQDGPSVQSLVSDAVYKFCGARVQIVGCGRTDSGVHAIAMPVHFDLLEQNIDYDNSETVKRAINFYLKNSPVSVLSCEIVSADWHARFSCVRRNYKYVILNRSAPPVLDKGFVWWVPRKLDVEKMKIAATHLIGNHDFTSFRATECQSKDPVKTLNSVDIISDGCKIILKFSARSFLHHQVRNMVGTLVEIGSGKPYDINEIFAARDRSAAGSTAPASGLHFVSADYATDDLAQI